MQPKFKLEHKLATDKTVTQKDWITVYQTTDAIDINDIGDDTGTTYLEDLSLQSSSDQLNNLDLSWLLQHKFVPEETTDNVDFVWNPKRKLIVRVNDAIVVVDDKGIPKQPYLLSEYAVVEVQKTKPKVGLKRVSPNTKKVQTDNVKIENNDPQKEDIVQEPSKVKPTYIQGGVDITGIREFLEENSSMKSMFMSARYYKTEIFSLEVKKDDGKGQFKPLINQLKSLIGNGKVLTVINHPNLAYLFADNIQKNRDQVSLLRSKTAVKELDTDAIKCLWMKWARNFNTMCEKISHPILGLKFEKGQFRDLNLEQATKGKGINQSFTDFIHPDKNGVPCQQAVDRLLELEKSGVLVSVLSAAAKIGFTTSSSSGEATFLHRAFLALSSILKKVTPGLLVKGRSNRSWHQFSASESKALNREINKTGLFKLSVETDDGFVEKSFNKVNKERVPSKQRSEEEIQKKREKRQETLKEKFGENYRPPQTTKLSPEKPIDIGDYKIKEEKKEYESMTENSIPSLTSIIDGNKKFSLKDAQEEVMKLLMALTTIGSQWTEYQDTIDLCSKTDDRQSLAYTRAKLKQKELNRKLNDRVGAIVSKCQKRELTDFEGIVDYIMSLNI